MSRLSLINLKINIGGLWEFGFFVSAEWWRLLAGFGFLGFGVVRMCASEEILRGCLKKKADGNNRQTKRFRRQVCWVCWCLLFDLFVML